MSSISQADFSNTIAQYQNIADKITPKTVTDSVDTVVYKFATTILENGQHLKNDNPQIAHTLNQYKQLADTRCSPEVRAKMEEAFELVFSSRTEKFNEGMDHLLHNMPPKDVGSFAEIHTEEGIHSAVQQLKELLQDPLSRMDFITYGEKQFVSDMLFLCDVDVNIANSAGNTFLHFAASSEDGAKAISALAEHGANLEAVNKQNQSPLQVAIESNHLPTIKALVRAGAKIPMDYSVIGSNKLSPEAATYIAKEAIKQAAANLPQANPAVISPPAKHTPGGSVQTVLGLAATGVGFVPESLSPAKVVIPLLKKAELGIEKKKEGQAYVALEEQINKISERIDELDQKIAGAKEPVKSSLIKEKSGLESDIRTLQTLISSEARNAEMEVLKKGIALQQGTQTAASALLGLPKEGFLAQAAKTATNATGIVTAAYTVFQSINNIQDLGERRARLQDVSTALNSAYADLQNLYDQIPDKNSLTGVLIEMKMKGISEQSKNVQKEIDTISSQIKLKATAAVGIAATAVMMGYACTQYYNRAMSGDTSVGVNVVVDNAATIGTVLGFLPSAGPAVASGVGWLWNRGVQALSRQAPPPETEQQRTARLNKEDETSLAAEKKKLDAELDKVYYERDVGYEIALATFDKPEPGSPEYIQFTNQAQALETQLSLVEKGLKEHSDARSLGMTRADFNDKFGALKAGLENPASRDFLVSIMKANGITAAQINDDPEGCLMKFLTT